MDWIFDGMKNITMKNTIIWENMDLELFPSASPINKSKFWVRNPKLILVVLEADSKEMTKGGWQLVEFFEGYDK